MYSVYKITNLINGKIYIGSSIQVEKRWRAHINSAFNQNGSTYYYPLYCALRKDGIDNFSFEVIADDFNTVKEMQEYEYQMILKYNSVEEGYNQTYNTFGWDPSEISKRKIKKTRCAKVDKNGNILEKYESYHEAARKNGFDGESFATKIRNICKGITSSYQNELFFRDLDETDNIIPVKIKSYKGKKSIIGIPLDSNKNEVYYDSISKAAQVLKTDRWSITRCIQGNPRYSHVKGYIFRELDLEGNIIEVQDRPIEIILQEYERTNPEINGERHTIKEWCKIYNISTSSYYARLRKGMGVIEALTTPKRN